jgi:hypothetical protein
MRLKSQPKRKEKKWKKIPPKNFNQGLAPSGKKHSTQSSTKFAFGIKIS